MCDNAVIERHSDDDSTPQGPTRVVQKTACHQPSFDSAIDHASLSGIHNPVTTSTFISTANAHAPNGQQRSKPSMLQFGAVQRVAEEDLAPEPNLESAFQASSVSPSGKVRPRASERQTRDRRTSWQETNRKIDLRRERDAAKRSQFSPTAAHPSRGAVDRWHGSASSSSLRDSQHRIDAVNQLEAPCLSPC